MDTNAVISLEQAIRQGDTPAHIENIADWHDEHSAKDGDRHDRISFRLRKLAHALRCLPVHRRFAA